MPNIKFKNKNGDYQAISNYNVQPLIPLQDTGESVIDVMSQNAVTQELNKKANTSHKHSTEDIEGIEILNIRTYTLDFSTSCELIQDMNSVGDIIIKNIVKHNVNKIFMTYDNKIKEEVLNLNNIDLNIEKNTRIVWEIERVNDEELACIGVEYIIV